MEFLGSRLKIDQMASLDSFSQVCQHMGPNDPSGVVRVMNAFLIGIKDRKQSLALMQTCQPFLILIMSNDFFNPMLLALQGLPSTNVQPQRAQQISNIEQSLQLLSTWL